MNDNRGNNDMSDCSDCCDSSDVSDCSVDNSELYIYTHKVLRMRRIIVVRHACSKVGRGNFEGISRAASNQ